MGEFVIKLPDVGEGVAEAELVEWMVEPGRNVREDEVLAAVMTDKATVEIPSPVEGKIIWLGANVGDTVAVGSEIIRIEIDGEGNAKAPAPSEPASNGAAPELQPTVNSEPAAAPAASDTRPAATETAIPVSSAVAASAPPRILSPRGEHEKPLASPAVRRRAIEAGVDLRRVPGSGSAGRITHDDLDAYFETGGDIAPYAPSRRPRTSVTETPVIGLRRRIAERMALSKSRIPHITYVDEIDVTQLEETRAQLNASRRDTQPKLTMLPFLMGALVKSIGENPQMNAHFDDDAGVIRQYAGVHIGVAAQTDSGLVVPVVRHAEAMGLWGRARRIAELSEAAKSGRARREDLTGSTITITSLGALGGVVTTPVINYPEVAIIGVNKIQIAPHWDGAQFVPRQKMNLSSSFDHRVIDGWNAAVFIQRIKALLENPATLFLDDDA